MSIHIIANIRSGKGKGEKCLRAVEQYLTQNSVEYVVHITEHAGHGEQLAREACSSGAQTVVALGGDGTLHEVLNGMDFTVARMGIIAGGRGNDFVTGTGAAPLDPVKAIAAIVRAKPLDLDYLQIGNRRCINVGGTGLDVEVLLKTAKSKNKLTYIASLFRCLLKFKPYPVTLEIDGETVNYDCIMAGVCNGTQFGGGIKLSPISVANDGLMDVIVMTKPKRVPTVFIMPKFVKGKHMNMKCTKHIKCSNIKIQTDAPLELDGEIYRDLPFDAKIVAGGLKTFDPDITD